MIKVYKETLIVLARAIRRLRPDSGRPQKNLFRYAVIGCLLFAAGAVQAQSNAGRQTVKGKVVDQTNTPLIGVSVRVKNTAAGVSTDAQGNFQISAAGTDLLQFSYIGYKSIERAVGSQYSHEKDFIKNILSGSGCFISNCGMPEIGCGAF